MIAVIFEVLPADGRKGDYLEHAARLKFKSELEYIDGFVSVERFQSLTDSDKLLSLSFWRDERAVARWRCHLGIVRRSRPAAVASVIRDYGMSERREQAPATAMPSMT